jgi:hypothetical protein
MVWQAEGLPEISRWLHAAETTGSMEKWKRPGTIAERLME